MKKLKSFWRKRLRNAHELKGCRLLVARWLCLVGSEATTETVVIRKTNETTETSRYRMDTSFVTHSSPLR